MCRIPRKACLDGDRAQLCSQRQRLVPAPELAEAIAQHGQPLDGKGSAAAQRGHPRATSIGFDVGLQLGDGGALVARDLVRLAQGEACHR